MVIHVSVTLVSSEFSFGKSLGSLVIRTSSQQRELTRICVLTELIFQVVVVMMGGSGRKRMDLASKEDGQGTVFNGAFRENEACTRRRSGASPTEGRAF